MAKNQTKKQKRKKTLQVRKSKDQNWDKQITKKMEKDRQLAQRKIGWIEKNGTTKLPKNFR